MTSEQRLDRLERIAKLFVRAGLRARRNMKEQDEKINIIINNQIEHDERLAALNQSIDRSNSELSRSMDRSHRELSGLMDRSHRELSQSIERTHRELSQSIERTHTGLSQSIERTHTELSQSIDQSGSELSQSFKRTHNELSQSLNELARAQTHTSGRLDTLIEIVRRDRNGSSN